LVQAIFDQVPWDVKRRRTFLDEWRNNLFEQKSIVGLSKPGRWTQCRGISDVKAAKFIKYFIEKFTGNPQDKKSGEIACVLWILIWIAQEADSENLTIQKVLQLSFQDIDPDDAIIKVDGTDVDISFGLQNLLLCLRGKGEGIRNQRLFSNLDVSGKALERALNEASKILFPNEEPVLPGAFLVFPHVYNNIRMSVAQRRAMRKVKPIIPVRYIHKEIKKALLHSRQGDGDSL
jgi:hypothetical protein